MPTEIPAVQPDAPLPKHSLRPAAAFGRVLATLVACVLILVAGGVGMQTLIRTSPKPTPKAVTRPVLKVETVRLMPQTLAEPIIGYGTARSDQHAVVTAQVAAEVIWTAPALEDGQAVRAGEALVRLDAREYAAHVERTRSLLAADEAALRQLEIEGENLERLLGTATAEFEVAQREYERVRGLLEAGNSNPREFDQSRMIFEQSRRAVVTLENQQALLPERVKAQQAAVELRRAEADLAAINLERCAIAAPFDGRIERVVVEAGNAVMPGQQLFTLLDPRHIEVSVEVPASAEARVRSGASCELVMANRPGARWRGTIARTAAAADPTSRTFRAFVAVDNAKQETELLPGMFVTARIEGPLLKDVLLLPRSALQNDAVFVLKDGVAQRRSIDLRRNLFENAQIEGVAPGTVVITSNLDALYDGVLVEAADAAGPPVADETPASPPTARAPAEGAPTP